MTAGHPATEAEREPILVRLRDTGAVEVSGRSDAPRRFHSSMPGYEPTPLRRAAQTAARLGVAEVTVKDESARLGLPSFKILGASWAVHRALGQRLGLALGELPTFAALTDAVAGLRPLALSAATDGNHGRAVARMAALLGLEARIYVPAGTAAARIEAIAGEGASVTVVDGGYDDAVRRSALDADARCLVISDTSWEGYEDVPGWVIEGYATIFSEIEDQLAEQELRRPDVVVVPVGVGALAAAAVKHFWADPAGRPRIVGVEPVSAACVLESVAAERITTLGHPQDSVMAGLNCATPSLVAWPLVSQGIDVYLAVDDARVPAALRLLAADGITAGETGAAGLAGLLRVVDSGQSDAQTALDLAAGTHVLLLCTEGATDPESYERLLASAQEA
jgi:diaminopropionate ammonia-lyase